MQLLFQLNRLSTRVAHPGTSSRLCVQLERSFMVIFALLGFSRWQRTLVILLFE